VPSKILTGTFLETCGDALREYFPHAKNNQENKEHSPLLKMCLHSLKAFPWMEALVVWKPQDSELTKNSIF
jgi:hypothetical protein